MDGLIGWQAVFLIGVVVGFILASIEFDDE